MLQARAYPKYWFQLGPGGCLSLWYWSGCACAQVCNVLGLFVEIALMPFVRHRRLLGEEDGKTRGWAMGRGEDRAPACTASNGTLSPNMATLRHRNRLKRLVPPANAIFRQVALPNISTNSARRNIRPTMLYVEHTMYYMIDSKLEDSERRSSFTTKAPFISKAASNL
jgi:hypothetical protein